MNSRTRVVRSAYHRLEAVMFGVETLDVDGKVDVSATVVVVNTDPEARRRVVAMLVSRGHRVLDFATARDAIDAMTLPRRTVLLVEHALADMSGIEFIEELRCRGLRLPTIMTVPMHAIQTAVQAIRNGATDVLEEPLDDAVLAQSVRLALAREGNSDADSA